MCMHLRKHREVPSPHLAESETQSELRWMDGDDASHMRACPRADLALTGSLRQQGGWG